MGALAQNHALDTNRVCVEPIVLSAITISNCIRNVTKSERLWHKDIGIVPASE
jgi:hypothetical protein